MESLTEHSPPAFFQLAEGQHFLLGEWMRPDGTGFIKLDGVSVTLAALGSGVTLDAERRGRVFFVTAGNLTLTNLRMINGLAQVHLTVYSQLAVWRRSCASPHLLLFIRWLFHCWHPL